jgi:hypothetical protein
MAAASGGLRQGEKSHLGTPLLPSIVPTLNPFRHALPAGAAGSASPAASNRAQLVSPERTARPLRS